MKIGFIGLGIMGRPMAKNLLKAGYSLVVYDKFAPSGDLVALGAEAAASNKDVAAQSDVIITMLPNSPHVREAVLGENGVLDGARPGTILVDMSSIAPAASQEICAAAKAKGVVMLDAPVSGGDDLFPAHRLHRHPLGGKPHPASAQGCTTGPGS